jgi:flagellar biosynthesis chaperone FliJ
MRYFLDGTWAAIASTLSCLDGGSNAAPASLVMDQTLQTLLDLQRDAEETARAAMDVAVATRAREAAVQTDLRARWRMAQDTLGRELASGSEVPATAAEAVARERYRGDLAREVACTARLAEAHRDGPLASALGTENQARLVYEEARVAREAALELRERAQTEASKLANRRAEDTASDHAGAACFQRGRRST